MGSATLVCLIATGLLVGASYLERRPIYIAAKIVASSAFLVVAWCGMQRSLDHAYSHWIAIGLLFGAIGDVALLGKSQRAFVAGLAAFLVGHVCYIVAFATVASPLHWLTLNAAGTVALSVIIANWLWPNAGKLRYAVMAYLAVITVMRIGSMGAAQYLGHPRGLCCALAGIAFYASDYCVAREKFVAKDFTNKLIGLPLYFAAQLLFAYSM